MGSITLTNTSTLLWTYLEDKMDCVTMNAAMVRSLRPHTQSVLVGNGNKNMAITTLLIMQTGHLLKSSVESDYVSQTKQISTTVAILSCKPLNWYSATPNTHCSFSEQVVSLNKIKEELWTPLYLCSFLAGYKPEPRPGYKPNPPNGCGSPLFGFQVS